MSSPEARAFFGAVTYTPKSEPTENLDGLTRAELYRRAQTAELPGRSKLDKAGLVEALRKTGPETVAP